MKTMVFSMKIIDFRHLQASWWRLSSSRCVSDPSSPVFPTVLTDLEGGMAVPDWDEEQTAPNELSASERAETLGRGRGGVP